MALTDCSLALTVNLLATARVAAQGNAPTNVITAPFARINRADTQSLAYGTASGKADIIAATNVEIGATSSATYDLYTGSDIKELLSGATAPFRKIKAVGIAITAGGDTSGVRIGGAASDEWVGFFVAAGDKMDIFPSGPPFVVGSPAGKTVGNTTKNLKIENLGAAAVSLLIVIAGTSV